MNKLFTLRILPQWIQAVPRNVGPANCVGPFNDTAPQTEWTHTTFRNEKPPSQPTCRRMIGPSAETETLTRILR